MTAFSQDYPWLPYQGNYRFFENLLKSHDKISNFKKIQDGFYNIEINDGRILKIFICDCYSFGIAEYHEVVEQLGSINAIVINSNWCGYSPDVKQHCKDLKIGVFRIGGFMGAINTKNFWEYLTPEEKEAKKRNG